MELPFFYGLVSVLIVSAVSLVGVFVLSWRQSVLKRLVFVLVGLSVGALFGDAFIHLIPEVLAEGEPLRAGFFILAGILIFFVLEKFLRWHHEHDVHACTGPDCPDEHPRHIGHLVLFSDGVHNFIDGLIIGASFLVSVPVGIASAVAIFLHEVPQEIGDFGVLLHAGYSRARALFYNVVSALFAVLGFVVVFALGTRAGALTEVLIAIAAGGFVYIAGADLVPELHKHNSLKSGIIQFVAILIGMLLMVGLLFLE